MNCIGYEKIRNLISEANLPDTIKALQTCLEGSHYQDDITLLSAQYASLMRDILHDIIGEDEINRRKAKISRNLLLITNLAAKDGLFSIRRSKPKSASEYAITFLNEASPIIKKNVLIEVVYIYFQKLINSSNEAREFIFDFVSLIPKEQQKFSFPRTTQNKWNELFDYLEHGFPRVPHFSGLLNFSSKELFESPALLICLEILKIIWNGGGYEKAWKKISQKNYQKKIWAALGVRGGNFETPDYFTVFSYYLMGYCARQNSVYHVALSRFNTGIIRFRHLPGSSRDVLLYAQLCKGIATVYRRKRTKSSNETEKQEFKNKALKIYEEAQQIVNKQGVDLTPSQGKVYSSILYGYGYFLFEEYFEKPESTSTKVKIRNQYQRNNFSDNDGESTLEKAKKVFEESFNANTIFTAPLSRKAIIELYNDNLDQAFQDFSAVYLEDSMHEEDNQKTLTALWCSMAIFHLTEQNKNYSQYLVTVKK